MKIRMNHVALGMSVLALVAAAFGWRNTTTLAKEVRVEEAGAPGERVTTERVVTRVEELERENAELREALAAAAARIQRMETATTATVTRVETAAEQIEQLAESVEESTQRGIRMRSSLASIERRLGGRDVEAEEDAPKLEDYVQISLEPMNGLAGPHIVFEGVNVHVRSGSGSTDDLGGSLLGLGNLIVGYNEVNTGEFTPRTGSHNLIVGSGHGYSSFGGLLAGAGNTVTAPYSTVSGGSRNVANGWGSTVTGGEENRADGDSSTVHGGLDNAAVGNLSAILGGMHSTLTEQGWSRMGNLPVPPT